MTKKSDAPAIRFKGFSDAWEQRKLGDMMNVTSVKRIHQSDWTDSGVRFLRARDIVAAAKNEEPDDYLYISKEKYEEYSALSGKVGVSDLLVTGVGTIGVPYLVRNLEPLYFKDGNIIWFQNSDKIDGKFLFYSFSAEQIQGFINESAGIGTVGTYTIESGKKTPISLPNQIEQAKVGEFFQQLDNLITLHQRQPFLHSPPDISLIVQLTPPFYTFSWEQRKLGELGTITTGSTPSTSIPDYYSDDGIVWVTPTDICENITFESARKLSDLGQQVGRVVPKNTILVTCIASIGKNTMLGNTGSYNQQINGLTPNEKECDPYFLLTESALWSAKMKSSAAAGTMQIVNRTEFSELKTWLPNLIEQQAISDFFRQLDNLITLHQRQTIVYAVIRSIRKVILAERQYFAPPMVRKSP